MLRCTIERPAPIPDTGDMTETRTSTDTLARLAALLLAVIAGLGLLAGCSSDGESAAAEDPSEVEAPPVDDVLDDVLSRFGVSIGDEATAQQLRDDLAALLVPEGTPLTDDAFIDALAARLGPEFDGVRDLDVLLDALVEQVGADGIESLDDLLAAVDDWATEGVIRIGGSASGDVVTIETSFEDAVRILRGDDPVIDLIPGIASIELRNVEIDVDTAGRTITITAWVPAPVSGTAEATITFTGPTPTLDLELRREAINLADLLPGIELADVGDVGVDDVVVRLDADGLTIAGGVIPATLPGVGELDLPAGLLPADITFPGYGFWTDGGTPALGDETIDVTIPLDSLPTYADWNTARTSVVTVRLGAQWSIGYAETLDVVVGGETIVFAGELDVADGAGALVLTMDGDWEGAFGIDWLTLSDVTFTLDMDDTTAAELTAGFELGGKTGTIGFRVESGDDGSTVEVTGTLADLTITDLTSIADTLTGSRLLPDGVDLPDDVFSLSDVAVSFSTSPDGSTFSMSATTELFGQTADAMVAIVPAIGGGNATVVAIQPRDIRLADLLPVLDGNEIVGDLALPETAIVLTGSDVDVTADELGAAAQSFFTAAYGSGSYDLDLPSGLSLVGNIPGGVAAPIDDLKELLGMDRDAPLVLAGTIPVGALSGSGGGEFVLDALLPEMRQDGEWFVSAQLGFRIAGGPGSVSVGVVGDLTLDIQGDVQSFEIEASIGTGPTGVTIELVGRLDGPWVTPFDVEWLTLNEVVLKLGFGPSGVTIGFLGDIQVGSKDIRGAIAVTITPAGVPSNFIFEAESAAGIGLGDLADLYALMSGEARPPVESVLPDVEIRNLALRFAPVGDPDLGVEQGFRIAGELWMASGVGGPLELVVGVDVELSDEGIRAAGFLGSWDLGPLEFRDTSALLEVSATQQRLAFSGGVTIAGDGVDVTLDVSRTSLSFRTDVEVNGGRAGLIVSATYTLDNPSFSITAVMDEQFIQNLDSSFEGLLGSKISDINSQIATARTALDAAEVALDAAEVSLDLARGAVTVACWIVPDLCDAIDDAKDWVAKKKRDRDRARDRLDAAERLLDRYDIQLTLVGAEFTASLSGFEGGIVTMNLLVDANGSVYQVPVSWDFGKSIDANLDGAFDSIVPA